MKFEDKNKEHLLNKLETIAKRKLGVATLTTRNSDRLDFHEVSAASIKEALVAAYKLGLES